VNFKEQVERDLKNVFHNTKEHADTKKIEYGGDFLTVPAVLDNVAVADRTQLANDNVDGICAINATLFVALHDLGRTPRQGANIIVDGEEYEIKTVGTEEGELVLGLWRLDE
jgi:hypothetical protein